MAVKLPYIVRAITYYTVSSCSCCIVLSRIKPEISRFCQSPTNQLRQRGSQHVWVHLFRKSRHSDDYNLGKNPSRKPSFVVITIQVECDDLDTSRGPFPVPLGRFNRFWPTHRQRRFLATVGS